MSRQIFLTPVREAEKIMFDEGTAYLQRLDNFQKQGIRTE